MENFHVEQLPRIAGTSGRNSSDKVKELAGCIVTWLAVGAGNAQNGLDAALASDAASRSIGCLYDFPNGQAAIQHIQNSIRAGRPYAVCSLPQLLHALIFSMEAEGTTGKHCAHFFLCAIELLRVIKAKGGKEQQGTIAYALERVKETDCRPLRTGIAKCLFLLLWLDAFFSTR